MEKKGNILIVDDNADILFALKLLLKKSFSCVETVQNPEYVTRFMSEKEYDVILLDMNFTKDSSSGGEGFYHLNKILEKDPSAAVIFLTAYGDVEKAVKSVKAGAVDFIIKPWQNEKLLATVMSAYELHRSKLEVKELKSSQEALKQILTPDVTFLGDSPAMQKVFDTIKKVASTDANVLILGENGTGKELVARSLHLNSQRCRESFIGVDLGSVTESLFESEIFGYVKGAFTDAKNDKAGRFEVAHNGTLFLDEIGNLSMPMQSKLLTVLERREVTRVGSNDPIPVNIRLICATNMNPVQMVEQEKFREDLLYRVNTVEIHLPPLRERGQDINMLADYFLKQYCKKYQKTIYKISAAASKELLKYKWPGNVRELRHAVERAVIMAEDHVIKPEDFNFTPISRKLSAEDLTLNNYNLENLERSAVCKVLQKYNGNISLAAKELGLTRTSLYRRMEKYGL